MSSDFINKSRLLVKDPQNVINIEPAQQTSPVKQMWGTIALVFISLGLLIIPSLFAMFILYGLLMALGQSEAQAQLYFDSTKGQFALTAAIELFAIAMIWVLMKLSNDTWRSIGLVKPKINAFLYFVKAFMAYYVLLVVAGIIIDNFTSINTDQSQIIGFDTSVAGVQLIFVFVSLVVLPPIAEEIMFRGYIYTRFKKFYSVIGSTIWVSLIFCLAHLQLGNDAPPLWAAAIDTFILSVILVYLREKTGSIVPGIGLHALKNGIAFVMLFLL